MSTTAAINLTSTPNTRTAWELRAADESAVTLIASELGISRTTARVLVGRRLLTPDAAKDFLTMGISRIHSPSRLADMDRAVARISQALQSKEKICIYGDYDVDGAVATAMLILFFEELGVAVDFYIPNRLTEGYSLNKAALQKIKNRGVGLLITVDNGIMAVAEAAYAQEIGLSVVITDHHQVGAELPVAAAVVNPQRKDCSYPFKGICGAGVAYKLMLGLRQNLRATGYFSGRDEPNLKQYLDLLCIPTVCDVVPLIDENRVIVREGLKHLSRTRRAGLMALANVCGLAGKDITAYDLGFRFGPRINACGRLEDASLGVRLLISKSLQEALPLAKRLDDLNKERRDLEQGIAAEAIAKVARDFDLTTTLGLAVYDPSWHIGVVGIVASRLVERYSRPVFVLATNENGDIKGSGRSIPGVNLVAALDDCRETLKIYGGHEAAAGATVAPDRVVDFARLFNAAIIKQMTPAELVRRVLIDDELSPEGITEALITELSSLEPFGMGNAKPLFAAQGLTVHSKRIVGEKHLKLKIGSGTQSFDAIAFNRSDVFERLGPQTGLLFGLEMNEFNKATTIQLVVKDFF